MTKRVFTGSLAAASANATRDVRLEPWVGSSGVGLLGFAPQELLDEQLAIAARFSPDYAIIAGGKRTPSSLVQLMTSIGAKVS